MCVCVSVHGVSEPPPPPQATERPLLGVNGLDVGLRPFDLVIPLTIAKGEITGTAPPLPHCGPITAPLRPHNCPITAPPLPHNCPIAAP